MTTAQARVWHYTVGLLLPKIIASGEIRPATAFLTPGENPVVWFSTNPVWEETANKQVRERGKIRPLTKQETHEMGGGLARIEVRPEAARYTWQSFKRFGISPRLAKGLEDVAREEGANPEEWRISKRAVPKSAWLAVEKWDGAQWVPADWQP